MNGILIWTVWFPGFSVSRYQYEDTKRAIIRLEQGSNSYMQRATASHNAFAVFYGRYLKYYIMKPEVFNSYNFLNFAFNITYYFHKTNLRLLLSC